MRHLDGGDSFGALLSTFPHFFVESVLNHELRREPIFVGRHGAVSPEFRVSDRAKGCIALAGAGPKHVP